MKRIIQISGKGIIALVLIAALWQMYSCKKKQTDHEEKIDLLSDTSTSINNPGKAIKGSSQQDPSKKVNPSYPEKMVEVSGYIRGGGNTNIILDELDIGGINPLESIIVNPDGSFKISTTITEPGIFQLRFPNGNIHLFLRGGQVKVLGDISNLGKYEVTGSLESLQLKQMYSILEKYNEKTYAIQDRINILQKDKTRTKELVRLLDSQDIYYARIIKGKSADLRKFIERIDTSMIAVLAAFYLDVESNYDYIISVRNKFKKICPNSRYFVQLDEKISGVVATSNGHPLPDMSLKDENGKDISLSSLKGKNSLLYFWTSDDEVCRNTNKKLKTIYNNFKGQGFEIFAISFDETRDSWITAINEDKLNCIHVSNLVGRNDEVARIFKIRNLPFLILVDKRGIIVENGVPLNALESRLRGMK